MYLANFLHIYQPSTQFPEVLDQIVNESYLNIVAILKKNPKARLTFNLASTLTEQLATRGYHELLKDFKELALAGQIEFTSSAKYHPLLPKLPRSEIVRQIELNDETNRRYLGAAYRPRGFFPPEMAYSRKLAHVLEHLGFEWLILDASAYPGKHPRRERLYKISGSHLKVFFRETGLSLAIAFSKITTISQFRRLIGARLKTKEYLLTALDGETFGHHQPQQLRLFESLCKFSPASQVLVSELLDHYGEMESVVPLLSTWGTTLEDVERGRIFPRWENPDNKIHKFQWRLTRLAIRSVTKTSREARLTPKWKQARRLLDKAVQSDQYWWASHNPCWHPLMIERGARMLKEVVWRSPSSSNKDKEEASELYDKIVGTGKELYGEEIIGC